jgi:uncharacterized phage protein (TIGR01671 family)
MRKIKFRGWHKVHKKMIDLHAVTVFALDERLQNQDGLYIPFVDYIDLMQFTGLKDKNGKDIYEGDILREPAKDEWDKINYACFEVFFHDGDANSDYNIGYSMNRTHYHGSVCGGYVPSFKPKSTCIMEVIGNIYENANLLKS